MPPSPPKNIVSLSKSALVLSGCTAWTAPDARWYDEELSDQERDTSKREHGTLVHKQIDNLVKLGGKLKDLEIGVSPESIFAFDYVQQVLGARCQSIQTEVPVGVNWQTGEAEILTIKDRQYPNRPGWHYGTADVFAILKDGSIYVGDWKTGGTDGAREQLLSLAYAFRQALGKTGGVTISCLKLTPEKVIPNEEPIISQELYDHACKMRDALRSPSAPNVGIHCTQLYCPHLAFCPAIGGDVQASAEAPAGLLPADALVRRPLTDRPVSDAEAGYVMARVSACNRQAKYLTLAMKRYIAEGGRVTLGNYEWKDRGAKMGFRWGKR